MTLGPALLVALGGALGAPARFWVDGLLTAALTGRRPSLPVATLVINVTGSLLLGVLTGLASGAAATPPWWLLLAGTGFCGGYTTFSTASVEVVRLALEGRWASAAGAASAHLVLCCAAAALGLALAG